MNTGSKISKIAVASVYYSSKQTRKADFVDHIAQSYNILCAKYGSDLKFIISGDFNRMKIDPILNLSPDLHQVVQVCTRRNPEAILDLIITNLQMYYHPPSTLEPLDNDEDNSGKPTDHLTVIWKPLTNENPSKSKLYKSITYRPFTESGIREMGQWIQSQTWHDVYKSRDVNTKVDIFEKLLIEKINLYFPEKTIRINEMDQPWMNIQLIDLDRRRKREYTKHKKSAKWKKLEKEFVEKETEAKESYYENIVEDLKTSNMDNGTVR